MILPPFFGIGSHYDEDVVRQILLTYLSKDVLTFPDPKAIASVAYESLDVLTHKEPKPTSNISFVALDTLALPVLTDGMSVTYNSVDICTYDPPPALPEITNFTLVDVGDREVDLAWSIPYDNRCDITEYSLEYSDCFLSYILDENLDNIIDEDNNKLISELYRDNCNWQVFDKRKVLAEDFDRIQTNQEFFIITELSSGVGTNNSQLVDYLENGQSYIFRVAAINCVGTGEYGYTDILVPFGPTHEYCDIQLFLQPNSTTDIAVSLQDYSCREKSSEEIAGVAVSTESKFGAGSIYFDGAYDSLPAPGTYSHIRTNHNYSTTLEDWSLNEEFTIELWLKPDSSSATDTIISVYTQYDSGYNIDNNNYWELYRTSNSIRFKMVRSETLNEDPWFINESIELIASNTNLSTSEFTHIAITRFDGSAKLYVNGELKDKQEFTHNISITSDLLIIGARQGDSYDNSDTFGIGRGAVTSPYIGYIDDIMISKAARYAKLSFIPEKYSEPADCDNCGGYTVGATSATVFDEFVP